MDVLAIIPARGGSKGIPGKNIKLLEGKPLLAFTAEAALASKNITRTLLSTDSDEIRSIGLGLGIEAPFLRPASLAMDDTPAVPVIQHAVQYLQEKENYQPDAVIILQPTSPLRTAAHIDEAITLFAEQEADSLVSVIPVPHQFNPFSVMVREGDFVRPYLKYDEHDNLRQKKPLFFARNGASIYIVRYDCLMNQNSLYGSKTCCYGMDKSASLDLDDHEDWQLMEAWLRYQKENQS